jgi:DNA-binding transcriptional MerR regulator
MSLTRYWTSRDVAELLGIGFERLHKWGKLGIVVPEIPAGGSGTRRFFVFRDLVLVALGQELAEHGMGLSLADIGRAVAAVRDGWQDNDPEHAGKVFIQTRPVFDVLWLDNPPPEDMQPGFLFNLDGPARGQAASRCIVTVDVRLLGERVETQLAASTPDGTARGQEVKR